MEQSFASRVLEFRKYKGLSQQAFAERCGLEQGNISQMEKGTEPKRDNVAKLVAGFPDLNAEWLLVGTAPMLRDGRALAPTPAPSAPPLRLNTDGESESYWKALAADRLEQLRAATEREKWLQGQFQELVGKSPASAYTAVPVSAPVPRSIGFGQMWLATAA